MLRPRLHLSALLPALASALPALASKVDLPKISNNVALPSLAAYKARSFWIGLVSTLVVLLNTYQIDLLGVFGEMGLGSTPDEVVAKGERAVAAWQMLAPLFGGIWIWIERRAPNFRLVWWGSKVSTNSVKSLIFVILLMGLAYAAAHSVEESSGLRGLV